jgi:hypothetical protein
MKHKSEARQKLIDFITLIKNQYNIDVKIIRSDNGPEFIMPQFYSSKGIIHQTSCVETPQQNGRVERKHQHILNIASALLFQAKLLKHFWSFAVLHAIFLINHVPSPILQNKCPYELLNGELPDLESLKVFGSLAYASTLQANRTKLSDRGRKCIYLGQKPGVKGTILYDLYTKEIFISRNVSFHDHILPYESNSPHSNWHYHTEFEPDISHNIQSDPTFTNTNHNQSPTPISNNTDPHIPEFTSSDHNNITTPLPTNNSPSIIDLSIDSPSHTNSQVDIPLEQVDNAPNTTIDQHNDTTLSSRPTRAKHAPSYLMDYVCNTSSLFQHHHLKVHLILSVIITLSITCHLHIMHTLCPSHTTQSLHHI